MSNMVPQLPERFFKLAAVFAGIGLGCIITAIVLALAWVIRHVSVTLK